MRISGQNSSSDTAKRLTYLSPKMRKNTSTQRERKLSKPVSVNRSPNESIRPQIKKLSPVCKTRKKFAVVSPQFSMEEDIDLNKQFGKENCFNDDDNRMWLSSDNRLSGSLGLSLDETLSSWLSTLENSYLYMDRATTLSDKPKLNLEEGTSLVLEGTNLDAEKILQEDLKEEQLTLLQKSLRQVATVSSVINTESSVSSDGRCSDDSTSFDNLSTPCSSNTIFDSSISSSSSRISDLDRMNFLVSLVNLDGDDPKWASDSEMEFDYLKSSFPSPYCSNNSSSEIVSSRSSVSIPTDMKDECTQYDISLEHDCSEVTDLEDSSTDEPLFWPFNQKPDWSSEETWQCFSMSPRKSTIKLGTPQRTKSVAKFHGRKIDSKVDCGRKLILSSTSNESNESEKQTQRCNNVQIKSIKRLPSRLRKSNKASMKVVPLETEDDVQEAKVGKSIIENLSCMGSDALGYDFASELEIPIETLLGLGEFDGHEGIDSEVRVDMFSLDESL